MPSHPAPACIVTLRTPPEDALPTTGLKVRFCPATTRVDSTERRTLRSPAPKPQPQARSFKLPKGLRPLRLFQYRYRQWTATRRLDLTWGRKTGFSEQPGESPEDLIQPTTAASLATVQVRRLDYDPRQADSILPGGRKTEFLEESGEPPEDLIHPTAAVSSAKILNTTRAPSARSGEAPGAAMRVWWEEPGQLLQQPSYSSAPGRGPKKMSIFLRSCLRIYQD
ncbi:hypothetical protein C8Q77DRAFT_1155931 [Trametes polyzona]|nr:hypothetical protein C8Q77DRAFT_1155931 [Trametes polyzona]